MLLPNLTLKFPGHSRRCKISQRRLKTIALFPVTPFGLTKHTLENRQSHFWRSFYLHHFLFIGDGLKQLDTLSCTSSDLGIGTEYSDCDFVQPSFLTNSLTRSRFSVGQRWAILQGRDLVTDKEELLAYFLTMAMIYYIHEYANSSNYSVVFILQKIVSTHNNNNIYHYSLLQIYSMLRSSRKEQDISLPQHILWYFSMRTIINCADFFIFNAASAKLYGTAADAWIIIITFVILYQISYHKVFCWKVIIVVIIASVGTWLSFAG